MSLIMIKSFPILDLKKIRFEFFCKNFLRSQKWPNLDLKTIINLKVLKL